MYNKLWLVTTDLKERKTLLICLKSSVRMKTGLKSRLGSGLEEPGYNSYYDQLKGINLGVVLATLLLSYQAQ